MGLQVPRRARHPAIGANVILSVVVLIGSCCCSGWAQQRPTDLPFFDVRSHQPAYVGPAGEQMSADQLAEIRIGYFGPSDPEDPLHGHLWTAAQRAIADANRDGGYQGKPFRLLPAWSKDPWGSGVTQVTQLVYRDRIWALVGGVDGPTTHLAEQVVVKARLALVSPVSTDRTVNLTNVPWMFSLAPGDHLVAEVLAPAIAHRVGSGKLVLVTTNDHDAFLLTRELRRALQKFDVAPRFQYEYRPQSGTSASLVRECLGTQPDVIIVLGNAADSLQLVRALRQSSFSGSIFGGPACGRGLFARQVGDVAGELVFPRLDDGGAEPADQEDYASRQVYDAVRLVTVAIQRAGLNRAGIGRAIRDLSPTAGCSGRIEWDKPGSNLRRPTLATLVNGRIIPLDPVPSE